MDPSPTPRRRRLRRLVALALGPALVLASVAACGDDGSGAGDSSDDSTADGAADGSGGDGSGGDAAPLIDVGGGDYDPVLDAADFLAEVDNPYFPLPPGSTRTYEGTDEDGAVEQVEVEVLDEARDVLGIAATVVRDTVTVDGELVEDTYDWFAQDVDGNVWYLGEDVRDYEDGEVVSTAGSFEAGVDDARPGIVMPADPQVGDAYRQEYDPGNAEDVAEVVAVGESVTVSAGTVDDVLVTEDWNPLEPEVLERKSYAPGIGVVYEEKVEGGSGEVELIAATGLA